jgi:hypothetical protein
LYSSPFFNFIYNISKNNFFKPIKSNGKSNRQIQANIQGNPSEHEANLRNRWASTRTREKIEDAARIGFEGSKGAVILVTVVDAVVRVRKVGGLAQAKGGGA